MAEETLANGGGTDDQEKLNSSEEAKDSQASSDDVRKDDQTKTPSSSDASQDDEGASSKQTDKVAQTDADAAKSDKTASDKDDGDRKQEGAWPDDWRQKLARDDEKKLERLGRFGGLEDLFEAWLNADKKISEGLRPLEKPGADASDEEWAEYRKSMNIPDELADYTKEIKLPDGREIGEDDQPIIEAFAQRALNRGVAPADMAELIDEYYGIQEEQWAQQEETDANFRRDAMGQLKEEYGGDFKANIAAMRPYFESVDEEMFDNLMGGRLSDGTLIGDNPGVVKFFVNKALQENPAATIMAADGGGLESIESEIKILETRMREDRVNWFKDTEAQQRYEKLIDARDRLAAK